MNYTEIFVTSGPLFSTKERATDTSCEGCGACSERFGKCTYCGRGRTHEVWTPQDGFDTGYRPKHHIAAMDLLL